jgi:large subunit ribosomal protein L22
MIINTKKFKEALERAGAAPEDLAPRLDRPMKTAVSALRNWSRGCFRPTPTKTDIENIASALQVRVKDIVDFDARHRWARTSPRKARLVSDLIRGQDVDSALTVLKFSKKRAAVFVRTALQAAIDSAEQNEANLNRLVVSESRVDEAPTIKRFQPKDRGRSHPIMKRTSHITVAVREA